MPADWVLLATADADSAGDNMLGAWLVTAAALVLSTIGRRRLPPGIGEGLFVVALSALLLLNFMAWGGSPEAVFRQGADLVSLALVWFIVAVWVERETGASADEELARRAVRRSLAAHAAAASGLLATAVLLSAYHTVGILAPGLVLLVALLLAVAIGLYVWRREALTGYGMIAVLVLLLLLAVPRETIETWRGRGTVVLLLAGAGALATVLAAVLGDWRRRAKAWQAQTGQLTDPPPRYRRFFGAVVAACALVGIGGVLFADAAATPVAVVLAAFAVFTVGHRWRSNAVGELGLVLTAEGIVTASVAWLPASPACRLLGWTIAGMYLAWLAGFWSQQLDQGRPWTTAGRLIPAARHLSYAAVGGQLILSAMWMFGAEQSGTVSRWPVVLVLLFMFAHWWLLTRDALAQRSATAALAACLLLTAMLVPVAQLAEAFGYAPRPCVLLAGAALALALRAGLAGAATGPVWPWNAYVGGILPGAVLYDLTLGGWERTGGIGAVLALVGLVLAVLVHWRRGLLTARDVL